MLKNILNLIKIQPKQIDKNNFRNIINKNLKNIVKNNQKQIANPNSKSKVNMITQIKQWFSSSPQYFHLDKQLEFDMKGEYLLFENKEGETQRKYFVPLVLVLLMVGCWSTYRMYQYNNRYKLSLPFYFVLSVFCLSRVYVGVFQYQKWINYIKLLENGKQVNIYTQKYIVFPQVYTVDIKNIQKPSEDHLHYKLNKHYFTVLIQHKEFCLPRQGVIHDQLLLPAVLNGKYITYNNQQSHIIVE